MSRVLGVPALLLVLVAGVLSACGSDPRDDAPVLEVAWTAELPDVWGDQGRLDVASDDLWIVRDPSLDRLTAVRLDDGSVAWQLRVAQVCALSEVNAAGLLAVQSGVRCERVGVVDTATGEQTWSAPLRAPRAAYPTAEGLSIGVTDATVTVAGSCAVERWAVADGRFLGSLAVPDVPADRARWACRGEATSGPLALVAGPTGLRAYDADTGAERWTLPGTDAAVARVHSADPLLVDLDIDGVRAVRELDPATGAPGPVLGRTLPAIGRGADVADPVGDGVVGIYHRGAGPLRGTYDSVVRGWDAESGDEDWVRVADGDDYLGSDARGTDLGRSVDRDGGGGYGYWVLRREPGRDDFRTVGWIEDLVLESARVGDLLITSGDFSGTTTAYRLPATTVAVAAPRSKDRSLTPEPADGDLRPGAQVDPCAAVAPSTLEALGFRRRVELPAPLDCRWAEGDRVLSVRVSVAVPREGRSAVDVAKEELAGLRAARDYADVDLADEAGAQSPRKIGVASWEYRPGVTTAEAALVLRWRNVVVEASYAEPVLSLGEDQDRLPRALFRAEQGLRTAALEALAGTGAEDVPGADDDDAGPAADGAVTRLPDVCSVLRRPVAALLPGARARDLTAPGEDRLRGCRWAVPGSRPFVQVVASASGPGALTGASAVESAEASYAASGDGALAEPVRAPGWDEAGLVQDLGGFRAGQRLTVRSGNVVLVVQVYLEDRDAPIPPRTSRRLAERLTDALGR
ncbi:hypothetical protein [Pimelobacter simplex]|uniref:hypothetical protein n=1 Tax=Nocardioides simplex TaxID=2045 RepID=UPI003AAAFA65